MTDTSWDDWLNALWDAGEMQVTVESVARVEGRWKARVLLPDDFPAAPWRHVTLDDIPDALASDLTAKIGQTVPFQMWPPEEPESKGLIRDGIITEVLYDAAPACIEADARKAVDEWLVRAGNLRLMRRP